MNKLFIFYFFIMSAIMSALPAEATTYFNPPVNTLMNGTTANASDVNGNFTGIISDGNTATTNMLAQIAGYTTGVPVGAVAAFNLMSCPTGWQEADGTNGSPDLRGKYIRGYGTGLGGTSAALGTYVLDSFQDHAHNEAGSFNGAYGGITTHPRTAGSLDFGVTSFSVNGGGSTGGISSGPAGGSIETRPISYVFNYCYQNGGSGGGAGSNPFSQPPVILPATTVPSATSLMTNYNRIISDGNTAFAAFQTAINAATGASAPSGVVVPFNLASCPSGWKASDGTSGTVDMRGSFARVLQQSGGTLGQFVAESEQNHTMYYGGITLGSGAGTSTHAYTIGGIYPYTSISSFDGIGDSTSGRPGTETVPKHVPLLYCQKS
jgi:hypothetical protein